MQTRPGRLPLERRALKCRSYNAWHRSFCFRRPLGSKHMSQRLWSLLALVAIVLLGAALRIPGALHRPFWFDEVDTWNFSVASNQDFWALSPDRNHTPPPAHPQARALSYWRFANWTNHFENAPLGYLLPRIVADLSGRDSEWVMRLPALIFGLLCIPAMYLLGCVVRGRTMGLLAALLAAVDPSLVDQSQQARMYTMLALFSILAAALAILILRQPQRKPWAAIGLGVCIAGALWSTLLGTMLWAGIFIGPFLLLAGGWLTGQPLKTSAAIFRQFTLAYGVALLLAGLGVYDTIHRLIYGPNRGGAGMPLLAIAKETTIGLKDLIYPHNPAGLVVYLLVALGLGLIARRCKTSAAVLMGVILGVLVLMIPFRRSTRFTDPRYFTILEPALWIGLAALGAGRTTAENAETTIPVGAAHQPSTFQSQNSTRNPQPYLPVLGLVLVLAYAGFQAWQSAHIAHWWQQPDRYEVARAILEVRKDKLPGDAAIVCPPVVDAMARYYHLPIDPTLNAAFRSGYQPAVNPTIPASFHAPVTWLIAGMINDNSKLHPADPYWPGHFIEALARHYHLTVTPADLQQHILRDHELIARFSTKGIRWWTLPPPE